MSESGSILGNSVVRLEDPTLLTGEGKYVDDLDSSGAARMVFVRSTVAHGNLQSVDIEAAKDMPGVLAIYHAAGDDLGLQPFQSFPLLPATFNRPVFATDRVRFVGDIVAAIVAETASQAVDAAETVIVDIDPLPAAVTPAAAAAGDAPAIFPEAGGNVCFATALGEDDPNEGADAVAEVEMVSQRLAGVPMEPNGCLMVPGEPEGGITCWISHQAPHSVQPAIAAAVGLEPEKVRVACPWVGGGFGPKAAMYVEYLAAAAAAQKLGRAVRWTETRSEDMLSLVHGRDYSPMTAKLGVTRDGRIVGLDASVVASAGAYPGLGAVLPMLSQLMAVGVYDIPKVRFQGTTYVTNTTPVGAYRGAGRPEATQLIERVIDVAADQIGMDPAEIRRKNYLDPNAFPLTTPTGGEYDSGEYAKALDAALAAAGYEELRAEQARRRDAGESVQLGIGISSYVEVTAPLGLHTEYGGVEVHDDGTASLFVGTSAHGQGHHTAFAMVASDVLGIPMDKIRLVNSDTATVPRGAGTMGSRSLQTAGNAVLAASNEVLSRAKQIAAHLLEASPDDIVSGEGGLHVAGVPGRTLSWAELASASQDSARLPEGLDAGPLRYEGDFDGTNSTFPFGSHVAVVDVDTETGKVTLTRHIAVDDCGRILNPLLVRGQQHGGIAQGAAQALFEWVQYDDDGNPLTGNLMDYLIPAASELPSFEASNTETDSPRNPLGAKGIGESGTIGSTPAVQNAVVDAVSHLGINHIDMPCSPQRVWEALGSVRAGAA